MIKPGRTTLQEQSAKPQRVLHIIQRLRPGGVQKLVVELLRNMDRQRIQFDFAVRTQQSEYYDEIVTALGSKIFQLPWRARQPLSLIPYLRMLSKIIYTEGPFTAVHSHAGLYSGFILAAAKRAGIETRIAHSHSAPQDSSKTSLRHFWTLWMANLIQKNATHLFACSDKAGSWLFGQKWAADPRSRLFPNGIDLTRYQAIDNKRTQLRNRLQLPHNCPLVGHIGRFDPVKNHHFLIEIFTRFLAFHPSAELILVGEGQLQQQIKNIVIARGISDSVHFLGVRSDVPQILGALDLLVLPSLHEGLGLVLIEAQAAGMNCLASDTVPPEVDIGVNLIHLQSLKTSSYEWASRLAQIYKKIVPDWELRKNALQNHNFDIKDNAQFLQSFYLSKPTNPKREKNIEKN